MDQNNHLPRILGIDPGSRVVGFALIEGKKQEPRNFKDWRVVEAGVLCASKKATFSERLVEIHHAIHELALEFRPTFAAIEKAFFGVSAGSAIKLGEARGALISAVGRLGIPSFEISPAQVKCHIAGNGSANKEQVYKALQSMVGFSRGTLPFDASDALAIALTSSTFSLFKHSTRKCVFIEQIQTPLDY